MIRVMLVDDEDDALFLMEILLQQIDGVTIVGRYQNPVAAIEALITTDVDAVFLDNHMPGMKGTEAARKIRELHPQMPIVFTTAYSEYAVEAFEIQSTDYLLKPITKARLQNSVMRIRQALSPSVFQVRPDVVDLPSIRCLGGFYIQLPNHDNRMLHWRTNKEKELCAFLIHKEGKPVNTASIIESLWPEYDLEKAKAYLYTCLSFLRKSLLKYGLPMTLHKSGKEFALTLEGMAMDVAEFEGLLDNARSDDVPDERSYHALNQLYKGEYMEGCDYSWAVTRQERIKTAYIRILRTWCEHFRKSGQSALAVDSLQRILAIVPESESDGRELIYLHMEAGNRNDAIRVYMQLEQAIRLQLGAELEDETKRLYTQIVERKQGAL